MRIAGKLSAAIAVSIGINLRPGKSTASFLRDLGMPGNAHLMMTEKNNRGIGR